MKDISYQNGKMVGVYSTGLCGYRVIQRDDDIEHLYLQECIIGSDIEYPVRKYKIQYTPSGRRCFVRPYGVRVYLDEILRVEQ